MTEKQLPPPPRLAQARPTIYIDVVVGTQRMTFDIATAHELVREVTAALKSLDPKPKRKGPPASKKRVAKKRSRKGK